jgi:hypothetical protein
VNRGDNSDPPQTPNRENRPKSKHRSQELRILRRKNLVTAFHDRYENDIPLYLRAIAHAHTFKHGMDVETHDAKNAAAENATRDAENATGEDDHRSSNEN